MASDPKYEHLRDNGGSRSTSSDEEFPMMGIPVRKGHNKLNRLSWSNCLVAYSAILTTIIFALVVTHLSYTPSHSDDENGARFPARFGLNLQYMTVAHKVDYLWDGPDVPTYAINIPDLEYGGEETESIISM